MGDTEPEGRKIKTDCSGPMGGASGASGAPLWSRTVPGSLLAFVRNGATSVAAGRLVGRLRLQLFGRGVYALR